MNPGPDFIIIGAMKCATSTIHDQLARQPGISMSEPKEPNFFSDPQQWERGLAWYQGLFAAMPKGDLKGESSTHYTKLPAYPHCPQRLADHLPNTRLIYVMRDPVDRLISQYIHEWSQRMIARDCLIDQALEKHPMLVDYSRYAMQLGPYLDMYGPDAVLPVFFERVTASPQTELERIARHIGYDQPVEWREDQATNVSATRQRRHPLMEATLRVGPLAAARRALLPESFRARIRSRWTMNERPELSSRSLARVREQLDPEMEKLGAWLGIELSCANFKDAVTEGQAPGWTTRSESAHV